MRRAATRALLVLLALSVTLPLHPRLVTAADESPTPPDVLGDREFMRSNYVAAEAYYRQALEARPADLHSLSRLATLLTWRGEYRESLALYDRGLKLEPSSMELRRGLATALCWSERYGDSLKLYRELLKERPGDEALVLEMAQAQAWSGDNTAAKATLHEMVSRNPRNVKARLLLAQVHGWSGEPAAAEKIYRSVLSEDAGNVTALTGLGDVLAAQDRREEALLQYDKALSLDAGNRKAMEGRARVFQSQGRTADALEAVRQALELYPDARDARRLGREIGGALRPTLQLFGSTIQDTDDNDLAQWGATYRHHFGGKGYAGVTFTHAQTDAQIDVDPALFPVSSATPVARFDTLRAIGGWHASEHFSLYGEAGPERTSYPFPEDPDLGSTASFLVDPLVAMDQRTRNHVGASLTLEFNGPDWFTLVATGSSERLVGTTQAFMNDVGIQAATLTAIFRPRASIRIRLTGQKALFTDDDDFDVDSGFVTGPEASRDNRRDLATGGVSWRLPLGRPRITVHYNYRWMTYSRNLDLGYFDPDGYASSTAGFDISDTLGSHFYWGGGIDAGGQSIRRIGGGGTTHNDVLAYRLLAGLNLGESAAVEAWYSRSDVALQSAAGFKSSEGGVRLVIKFGSSLGPAAPGRRPPQDGGRSSD